MRTLGVSVDRVADVIRELDTEIGRKIEQRNSDVSLKEVLPILAFLISAASLLLNAFPVCATSDKVFLAVSVYFAIIIGIAVPVLVRKKSWDKAFKEGNISKLRFIREYLFVFEIAGGVSDANSKATRFSAF